MEDTMTISTLNGQFDLRHDEDYFRVTLVAGQRYQFTMTGSGASPVQASWLELFRPGSDPVVDTADVNDYADTGSGGAKFAYVATVSGVFFLRATLGASGSNAALDTGNYTVGVAPVALDDHSDLAAQGTSLALGATLSGQFDRRGDLDYFRVNLAAGQRYLFAMTGSGATPVKR